MEKSGHVLDDVRDKFLSRVAKVMDGGANSVYLHDYYIRHNGWWVKCQVNNSETNEDSSSVKFLVFKSDKTTRFKQKNIAINENHERLRARVRKGLLDEVAETVSSCL